MKRVAIVSNNVFADNIPTQIVFNRESNNNKLNTNQMSNDNVVKFVDSMCKTNNYSRNNYYCQYLVRSCDAYDQVSECRDRNILDTIIKVKNGKLDTDKF